MFQPRNLQRSDGFRYFCFAILAFNSLQGVAGSVYTRHQALLSLSAGHAGSTHGGSIRRRSHTLWVVSFKIAPLFF